MYTLFPSICCYSSPVCSCPENNAKPFFASIYLLGCGFFTIRRANNGDFKKRKFMGSAGRTAIQKAIRSNHTIQDYCKCLTVSWHLKRTPSMQFPNADNYKQRKHSTVGFLRSGNVTSRVEREAAPAITAGQRMRNKG